MSHRSPGYGRLTKHPLRRYPNTRDRPDRILTSRRDCQVDTEHDATGMRLDIDIGTPLFLEVRGVPGKFKSKLIGMDVGRFLIIATPAGQLPPGAKVDPDTFIKVRYVHQGSVYGFETFVRGIVIRPARLLLVAYPQQVAEQSLRKAERFDCHIACEMVIGSSRSPGTLVDISTTGGRCVVPVHPNDDAKTRPAVGAEIALHLHTHEAGEVVLPARVVNINEHHGAAQLGLCFGEVAGTAMTALEKVVMPFTMD